MLWVKRHISIILFFVVVTVGFTFSPTIGPAWDEPDNIFSGGVYVNFFEHNLDPAYFKILTDKASVWGDRIIPNDHLVAHLPPIHNYVGILIVLGAQALHINPTAPVIIIAWHLATVLFFAILVTSTYELGLVLGLSQWASLFAAILVFLYPQIFGHGLSNSKDTAQAALVTTSLYFLVRGSMDKKSKTGINNILIGAVVWGLGMATKFNAVYVPIIWGIWNVTRKSNLLPARHWLRRQALAGGLVVAVGLVTVVIVWPYLWFDPVGHFKEMVVYFLTVGRGYHVLWNGVIYTVGMGKSLWWYPWASLFFTTPPIVLVLLFLGIAALVRSIKQKPFLLLLPIWILVPMIRTLSPWTAFYDQLRHFLEIIPACMLLAAIAFDLLYKKWRYAAIIIALISVGHLVWINATLFPYSTGYYNIFAKDPNVNFDRDMEGLSIKEEMDWLHSHYGSVKVWAPIAAHLSWPYLTATDRYIFEPGSGADSIIIINKQVHNAIGERSLATKRGFTLVHTISRGDAVFGWVYRRN